MKKALINVGLSLLVCFLSLAVSTGLCFGLDQLGLRSENLLLIYLLAILGITIVTKKIYYPIASSIASVLLFNFFFTDPKYSFAMTDPNYYISLALFLVVSVVIFTITSLTQKEAERRRQNEKKLESLNHLSTGLLLHSSKKDVLTALLQELNSYFGVGRGFVVAQGVGLQLYGISKDEISYELTQALRFSIKENKPSGTGEAEYSRLGYYIYPLSGQEKSYGVVVVSSKKDSAIKKEEKSFISSLSSIASMVLDKDEVIAANEKASLEVENEKFKTALLRSLSHDIRTPLTALQTGSSFLLEGYAGLDDESKRGIIKDMNEETERLTDFVDNLLSLTRVSSGMQHIPMHKELVDDLLDEAVSGLQNRLGNHKISTSSPPSPVYVLCDAKLIIQVLRNLINNAIVHTKDGSWIKVSASQVKDKIMFMVIDNGGGLSQEASQHLFEEFSSFITEKSDKYRGNGLGLSICASIVKAHHGTIEGHNNDVGGATFSFLIPIKGEAK